MPNDYYRVIEIIDEYSILINYGRDDGANEDDKVRIIGIGPKIIDPETREELGTLDLIKATLTITTTYDKFSLCEKVETTTKNILISPLSQFQTTSKITKPLKVDKEKISNKKTPSDTTIKIGDKVKVI